MEFSALMFCVSLRSLSICSMMRSFSRAIPATNLTHIATRRWHSDRQERPGRVPDHVCLERLSSRRRRAPSGRSTGSRERRRHKRAHSGTGIDQPPRESGNHRKAYNSARRERFNRSAANSRITLWTALRRDTSTVSEQKPSFFKSAGSLLRLL